MAKADRWITLTGPKLRHSPAFDGFRGFGVLIVVFYHAEVSWFLGGSVIVIDWFFVASGFLITSLLLDERAGTGSNSLRRFYERRILRLFPAMYAMLLVVGTMLGIATVAGFTKDSDVTGWWVDIVAAATYSYYLVAAIIPDKVTGVIGHTWSLSLEEQFYFLWPFLFVLVLGKARKVSDQALIFSCVAFVALMIGLRFGLQNQIALVRPKGTVVGTVEFQDIDDPTLAGAIYRIASFRPDMIIFGCLLAILRKWVPSPLDERWRKGLRNWGFVGFVIFFVFVGLGNRLPGFRLLGRGFFDLYGGVGYQIALLMIAPFVMDLYLRPEGFIARLFSIKVLQWLGVRSYGIYLWHVPALLLVYPALQSTYGVKKLIIGIFGGLLGIGAGLLSFRYIEKPFLRLKDTKYRRPQDSQAPIEQPSS
ncbi:MAG TPA: acyltransferase [Microthrixaceae bacterium]|nr:acyltransferase [Microthrixaceae bacterium]